MTQGFRTDFWYKLNLGVEHVNEFLWIVLHNKNNDTTYRGLPEDEGNLYAKMVVFEQNQSNALSRVIKRDQWNILCPANGKSNSKQWDITLIAVVIKNLLQLPQILLDIVNDSLKIRNKVKHTKLCNLQKKTEFDPLWNELRRVLTNGNYSELADFDNLYTGVLKFYTDKIVQFLEDAQKNLEIDVHDYKQKTNSEIASINIQLSNLRDAILQLQQDFGEIFKAKQQELSSNISNLEDKFKALSMRMDRIEERTDNIEEGIHVLDSRTDNAKEKVEMLDEKVEMLNEKFENRVGKLELKDKECAMEKVPIEWNIYQPVGNFHGRKELLEQIHHSLYTAAENGHKPVLLFGIGGIGKTETAAMYMKQYQHLYLNTIWINAPNMKQSLMEILLSSSYPLIPHNASIEFYSQMLSKHIQNEKTLMVIDDLEEIQNLQKLLRNLNENVAVLVTTQLGTLNCGRYHLTEVECFDNKESISFLQKELHLFDELIIVEELALVVLQSFPLAMQQAICYIKKYNIPIMDYIGQFNESNRSLLNINIGKSGFTDYEKTLLTVWNVAFEKLNSNPVALNILGMMAYMDHNHINRKTFLYYHGIKDEFELNKVLELLSEFSLVHEHVNGRNLQIHPLVQKIIRLSIEEELMTVQQKPLDLLATLLSQVMSLFEKDLWHTDELNLWYPHFCCLTSLHYKTLSAKIEVNLAFFTKVSNNRYDDLNALNATEFRYRNLKKDYKETKDFNLFLEIVNLHRNLMTLKINLHQITIKDLLTFEKVYEKELRSTHPTIIKWKIAQAFAFLVLKKIGKYKNLITGIYNQVYNEEVKYDEDILVTLAASLIHFDVGKCKQILKKSEINERESDSSSVRRKLSVNFRIAMAENKFNIAEELLINLEKHLKDAKIPSNHFLYLETARYALQLLFKRGKYNEILQKVDECIAVNPLWWNGLRYSSIRAWINLKKYKKASELFSELPITNLDSGESLLLAYLKFLRHDFDCIYELLETELGHDRDLCYCIKLYETVLTELEKKRRSVETSQESLSKLVENCVQSKRIITGFFKKSLEL